MARKIIFGGAMAIVALSVVSGLIGVTAVWEPMELFQIGAG